MAGLIQRLIQPGSTGPFLTFARRLLRRLMQVRTWRATSYQSPSEDELVQIEHEFARLQMPCEDFHIDATEFRQFANSSGFPSDYHGGATGGVYDEKLLEHFVAWKLLSLDQATSAPYVDIAACASPWAMSLRKKGVQAYAIDLEVAPQHATLEYYLQEDATNSSFASGSIGTASLQCAYEMFIGEDDIELLAELARILRPGGRAVISPLYTHTHACYYQTPEYYGLDVGDPGATAYIRRDCWGVAASRKYSPQTLRARVWDTALKYGLIPSLLALRNKHQLDDSIYLHFILILDKPIVADDAPRA